VQIDPKGWFTLAKFVGETISGIAQQSCQPYLLGHTPQIELVQFLA
jgi:hypothetical protein